MNILIKNNAFKTSANNFQTLPLMRLDTFFFYVIAITIINLIIQVIVIRIIHTAATVIL